MLQYIKTVKRESSGGRRRTYGLSIWQLCPHFGIACGVSCGRGALRDFIAYVGTAAGAVALAVPYWFVGYSIVSWEFLRFYTCHILLLLTSLLPLLLGRHKLSFRHFWKIGFCFIGALVGIFLNQFAVYSAMGTAQTPADLYTLVYNNNPVWMCHPNARFVFLTRIISFLTPSCFLGGEGKLYTPILWYAVPLYVGITGIAFLMGMLVDRAGFSRMTDGVRRAWQALSPCARQLL